MLVRLASWMPFEQARELLQEVLGIQVSKATARRATLQAGEAALSVCESEGARLKQEVPQAPAGAEKQAMSADGAEWLQGFVDHHRADAVRILDFAHAAEYSNEIGQAVRAAGGRLPPTWLEGLLHRLKHQGPHRVLKHLVWLAARYPSPAIQEQLSYLLKREVHMQYPTYQQAGWPIGSGSVESANKVVVEARLKGAGRRLPSAERQSHAGAAQCGLQSAVARDVGGSGDPASSAAYQSAASREPAAAGQRLLDARLLGSACVSAVSPACSGFHLSDG
jgi:hypothetical protein